MTISTTAVDVTYSPDGSTTEFALPFAFADADHVVVELDGEEIVSGYSITGAGDEDGGTLTFEDAPAAGTGTLYAYRETPVVQEIAPVNNSTIFAPVFGRGLDLAAMRTQELKARLENAIAAAGSLIGLIGKVDLTALAASTGSALVGFLQSGTGAVLRTQQAKNRDIVSVKDFGAVGDGVTNDAAAINAAILAVYNLGGGTVIFPPSASGYACGTSSVYLVNGVTLDLCGQTIVGSLTSSLFKTALVSGSTFTPITVFDPFNVVRHAHVRNGYVSLSALAFDLVSFTLGCTVENIEFYGCIQGFKLLECFYSRWQNLTADPSSGSPSLFFYHLRGAANAMVFDRVTCTVTNGWLIENGSTALTWLGCTFEGGANAFKFKNDNLGLVFQSCYFESVTDTIWDFSEAGACNVEFYGTLINGAETVIDDGGAGSTATLTGRWHRSNFTGGGLSQAFKLSAPRNFLHFEFNDRGGSTQADLALPANITASPLTSARSDVHWFGNTLTDVRARAAVHAGVLDHRFSGDTGTIFTGSVPYSVVAYPTSGTSTLTIDTKIKWNPTSVRATFVLRVASTVFSDIYGDIYGAYVKQHDASGKTVTISDNGGFLRLSITSFDNTAGDGYVTGTVRLLA